MSSALPTQVIRRHYALAGDGTAAGPGAPSAAWPIITGYEILGELGRGGMGVLYTARQIGLDRLVVLKMILHGGHAGPEHRARFRLEAEAIANLQHPNIVQIYDIGQCEGRPYFTMEYIEGGSLADHIDGTPRPPRVAARVVEVLARAIHAAHERGIIHRDLKPANVLLSFSRDAERSARPDALRSASRLNDAIPKITDFGLARRLDDGEGMTQTGQIMGTPGYMAPEQALGSHSSIGPATDVYALGILLYEMLTGRAPFRGVSALDTIQLMLSEDPLPPCRLQPRVPRDLETICLRCLRKESRARYGSAEELALDLDRFLEHEPIQARPASSAERAWKWARRRPAVAALSCALAALVILSFALVTWQWRRAEDERRNAVAIAVARAAAQRESQQLLTRLLTERGLSQCRAGEFGHGLLWLARAFKEAPEEEVGLRASLRRLLGGWYSQLHPARAILPHSQRVKVVAFSPQGTSVLTVAGSQAQLWSLNGGKPTGRAMVHPDEILAAAYSPSGQVVATAGNDGTARLWNAATGAALGQALRHQAVVRCLAFSADGKLLLTGSDDKTACLWDGAGGAPRGVTLRHRGPVRAVAFGHGGAIVATASDDATAQLWDVATGQAIGAPMKHFGPVHALAVSRDGKLIMTGGQDSIVRFWDGATGRFLRAVKDHSRPIQALAFSPDGKTAVTAGEDHRALLWDLVAHTRKATFLHMHEVQSVAFSADSRFVLTGSDDHTARLWSVATGQPVGEPLRHHDEVSSVAISPDGNTLLTAGGDDQTARLWARTEIAARQAPLTHPQTVTATAFAPDRQVLFTACADGRVRFWHWPSGRIMADHDAHKEAIIAAALTADASAYVTGSRDKTARLWASATGKPLGPPLLHGDLVLAVAFGPTQSLVATGGLDGVARVWDAAAGKLLATMVGHKRQVASVAFSPDGKTLLTASWDKTAQLWDVATGKPMLQPMAHADFVQAVAFSPDGRLLVSGGDDYTTRVWEAKTGRPVGLPLRHPGKILVLAFSHDGKLLATGSNDKTARLWEAETGRPLGPVLAHARQLSAIAFSRDGKLLATGSWDMTARVWNIPPSLSGPIDDIKRLLHVDTGLELNARGAVERLTFETWQNRFRLLRRSVGPR